MALVAGKQVAIPDIADLTSEQFQKTFAINVFALFWLTCEAIPATERCKYHHHFVNPCIPAKSAFTGLCGYEGGDSELQPWPAKQVAEKGIRVNIVAPCPIWTALQISGGQTQDKIPQFGQQTPMKRAGNRRNWPLYMFIWQVRSRATSPQKCTVCAAASI